MTKLYVYRLENSSHDYGWTYSPAFSAEGGLTENADAEKIEAA